jgi:hypothetical protein
MRRVIMTMELSAALACGAWCADDDGVKSVTVSGSENRSFFPQDSIRGYVDFQIAPPHNEVDLGLCALTTSNPYPLHRTCTAYARYVWSGYMEVQPMGRGLLRGFFIFIDPKVFGGENLPQQRYTASAAPILWESTVGAGFELPKNFELRLTHHQVYLLGRYTGGAAATLRPDGPYGLNTTAGVRWNFGGWGHSSLGSH